MMRSYQLKPGNIFLFVIFCLVVTYIIKEKINKTGGYLKYYNDIITRIKLDDVVLNNMRTIRNFTHEEKSLFWFVPQDIKCCEEVLQNKVHSITQARYNRMKPTFDNILHRFSDDIKQELEEQLAQTETYLHLANSGFIKTICETGFNSGHSTLAWLTANPRAHVYSFGFGEHSYSKPMANFLNKAFPGRLKNIWGNSTITIPNFIKSNLSVTCDLTFVDGGHSYELALSDLKNLRTLSNPNYNLLILNDCPHWEFRGVCDAWQEMVLGHKAQQLWQCYHRDNQKVQGFTIGKFIE